MVLKNVTLQLNNQVYKWFQFSFPDMYFNISNTYITVLF